jgi:hypothetical protein
MIRIGIAIIATNAYFPLGIRFIKRFIHHYRGNNHIKFFFFSDESPTNYIPDGIGVHFIKQTHTSWVDSTNSKFKNIIDLEGDLVDIDYFYYFDADTNVTRDFTEEWFLGNLVGGEHFGNRGWLANCVGYDKNPMSAAYVPQDTPLPCMYYYGAFFGGKTPRLLDFCNILYQNQLKDKKIFYEPGCNDESYINNYFHYNPPTKVVLTEQFMFDISDKGGIGDTRNMKLDVEQIKQALLKHKNDVIDIKSGNVSI